MSFLFAPAAGRGTFQPSADGESPAEVQRKTSRPERANTLTQFVCPGQPVQKKEPPVRDEHANAVRAPRSVGAGKRAAPLGANTLTQFAYPGQPVQEKEPPVRGEHAHAVRAPRLSGAGKRGGRKI